MSNVFHSIRCGGPAALIVACLAMFGAAAHAQSAALPTAETTAASPVPINDWQILSEPSYDYTDLILAKTLGYSDSQRASIAKVARLTGLPFTLVLNQVHQGRTFALLAFDYGLRLGDVLDASGEQARIDEYLRLYRSLHSYGFQSDSSRITSTQTVVSGPTLAELEAHYNQLSAAFPALPPTDIETAPIGTPEAASPMLLPPAPIIAAPAPQAPAAARITTRTTVIRHTIHRVRPLRRSRTIRRHRSHKPAYMTHRGS